MKGDEEADPLVHQLTLGRWYFFFKFPQFIPGIMIMIVTQVCGVSSYVPLPVESDNVLSVGPHHWVRASSEISWSRRR